MSQFFKKSHIYFLHIFLTLLITVLGYFFSFSYNIDYNSELYLIIFCWIGNVLFIWCLWSWKVTTKVIFSPYSLFLSSTYVYLYGQAILKSFGLEYTNFNLYMMYDSESLLRTHYYTCLCLAFIHLGALITAKENIIHNSYGDIKDQALQKSLKIVGYILAIISVYPFFSHYIEIAKLSIASGYRVLFDNVEKNSSGIMGTLQLFFIPSSFLLLVSYKEKLLVRFLIITCLMTAVVLGFVSGGRGSSVAILVSLAWLWHVEIKPFKGVKTLLLIFLGLFVISLFPTIGSFRGEANKNFLNFINMYFESIGELDFIVDAIGNMGGSMFPLIETMRLIPNNFDFANGLTYLVSFIMIVPSFFRFGAIEVAASNNLIFLGDWLMNTLKMTYGPGFSILAEAYYNFGWFGVPFMSLFGFLMAYFMRTNAVNENQRVLRNIFAAVMLYNVINMVRATSTLLIKFQFYYVFIPLFLIIILYNNFKKTNNRASTKN